MIKLKQLIRKENFSNSEKIYSTMSLPIETRIKSRALINLDNGEEAGFVIERGHIIRGGDILTNGEGIYIQVQAANETVSSVYSNNHFLLMRTAYHLGNRHVPLQVTEQFLRYQHDHVLDEMVKGLGLTVQCEQAPFEPEAGAYHSESQGHSHAHSHHH